MRRKLVLSVCVVVAVGVSAVLAQAASAKTAYTAIIEARAGTTSLGYLQADPNYWTPLLTPDATAAMHVAFTLDGKTGLVQFDSPDRGYLHLGLVVGRDSTSANIGPGSFNYLYLDPTDSATIPPPPDRNYFADSTGLAKPGQSLVWNVDLTAADPNNYTASPVWVNTDATLPTTYIFVQSNHVYAGGDPAAFLARFPAPVTTVTLYLHILTTTPLDPTSKDQCMNGGWATFTSPHPFKNQGDCIQYVNTGK